MGYEWTTSNLTDVNINHNGSLEFFPSSTKAETMAILTALIVSPQNSSINIYTDSQAAIDTFHKSSNLISISSRRFNKINNNILWSTVHYIIDKLNLHITLYKVKAHSNNAFNDIADAQAKVGRLHQTLTSINHRHLPSQMITTTWNNEIPIDKDVRKCIGTISNYKRIEDYLNHPSLIDIKEATAQHIINWSCTSKWFNYNGHETATSTQHTKDTAWKLNVLRLIYQH
ncbi:hypothetical protein RhiirC2_788558 [Rhizophagus irregularis]|uniref:RNase H type-1 domain-containing protein n=1 Tax=Rhizophagus irregularis TaxID=588596 RepID=A0A2N1MQ03_9GLOM|nr:hypothetical protein RhiirC2_788558 [Rhizophagus irregularis]